jgi:PIN domain nuclease of toxin-antitoxin system
VTYLLDTHALLWALTNPAHLGHAARSVIEDRSCQLFVSTVSAWELSTKHRLGKLPQADVLLGAYSKHLDRLGATRLPVAENHALLAGRLEWDQRDPFDRMLAAQAMIESLVIVTGDTAFATCRGVRTLW